MPLRGVRETVASGERAMQISRHPDKGIGTRSE